MPFSIESIDEDRWRLRGQFLASHAAEASEVFDRIGASCKLDVGELTYISSSGLRLLIQLQARLMTAGHEMQLENLSAHLTDLLAVTGLDGIFNTNTNFEPPGGY